ncbi:helix-turn-helix transcriptional regulator [Lactococcus laudensis]|uniref:Helix-turn-helix transcriptional regulator n=1 Tax=Pseudolactococcus laudensis TaxID=1494461 RepID=A0A7V8SK89_9LACT|nr:XRE family transcriptional regulator [Lactococcus laudensis]MBA0017157.1 helix-turn-helix transcriptional regulator [Lactococcus laudensis]MBW9281905.1 XRE family transcriptional regulator [Lactococcus laudensis]
MEDKIKGRTGNLGNKETMSFNIKRLLDSKRMNPHQFADTMGFKYTTVMNWIKANSYPRIDKIELMARYFGVDKSDLVEEYNPIKEKQSTTKQILDNIFNKLEKPRQDKVVAYAKSELDEQNKVVEIADYQIEKEYPYYDDAVSAGTGQYIGTSQRETITLPVDFDADYVVPVYGDSMEPEYHDGDYIFIESTVNLNDGEIGVFEYYGDTYVKQLILEDDHACLHSFNEKYKDMKVDADSDFRILGRVVGRYSE